MPPDTPSLLVPSLLAVPLVAAFALAGCSEPEASATWTADIQPVMATHCESCHREGGQAPFSLSTVDDVRTWANLSLAAMESGSMPPYQADPDCRTFVEENVVSAASIASFREWIDADMPEGEAVAAPVAPPTLATIQPTHSASVPGYVSTAVQEDDYRCFLLDLPTDVTRYVQGSDVTPATPQVHHVLVYAMSPDQVPMLEAADGADGEPGYTCFGSPMPSGEDDGEGSFGALAGGFPNQIAGWVPGQGATVQPDDLGIRVEAGGVVVMQVHYSALGGAPEPDTTELGLVLTEEPPAQLSSTRALAVQDLDIPAGAPEVSVTRTFTNYGADSVTVRGFTGHMHLLGTRIRADVVRADGSRECALDIPNWDFEWQSSYSVPEGEELLVAQGDSLELTCVYDNSAANQPVVDGAQVLPRDVEWGEGTLDEMCLMYFRSVEDTVLEEPGLPCEGADSCLDACGDDPTLDCLLSCEEVDSSCSTCVLSQATECGMTSCMLPLLGDRDCLVDCALSSMMLGGSLGACMAERCGDSFDSLTTCADPILDSGACDDAFAQCGVGL